MTLCLILLSYAYKAVLIYQRAMTAVAAFVPGFQFIKPY